MKRYKFYEFVETPENLDGWVKPTVRNIREMFAVEYDQPYGAFNQFRKSHETFDLMVEDGEVFYAANGSTLVEVTLEAIFEYRQKNNINSIMRLTEDNIKAIVSV